MSDDLTVLGADGILRSYDEHYDTMMGVEQDPTGAHQAIQRQHARIEELEERLEKEMQDLDAADRRAKRLQDRIEELEAKLAMADKLASEFKNCLEVLTKEDDYVCCSGHQCGCYGASLHAQAIYYANEAIDDYHKTTGGKDE